MYTAAQQRYESMTYRRCGKSGLLLPAVSLGLWQNFGTKSDAETRREILCAAFDAGITYFDLANNYGPVYGAAEENFGVFLQTEFKAYRREIIVSTKAGWDMWSGPYGDRGSRKYLLTSLDESLTRLKLDYVDIFYHHRFDPHTPLEETAEALDSVVRSGKALYVGISNYGAAETRAVSKLLRERRTPFVVHQPRYNMLDRELEEDGLDRVLVKSGIGAVCYSPLAQGLLSDRYLEGIPASSRAHDNPFLNAKDVEEQRAKILQLNEVAISRGQSLAQMAVAWNLRLPCMSSVIVGVSSAKQLSDNLGALKNLKFSKEELRTIDLILKG